MERQNLDISLCKALVVDDNETITDLVAGMLTKLGLRTVYKATNGIDAIKLFLDHKPDIVFADFVMEEIDGVTLMKVIKILNPNTPVVIFTGYYDRLYKRLLQEDFRPEYLIQKPSVNANNIKEALTTCLPQLEFKGKS